MRMRGGKKSGKMFEVNILPGVQSTYHKNGAFGLYLEWFLLSWHVYFTAGGVFLQMRYTTWSISWSASINVRIQPCNALNLSSSTARNCTKAY